jgi:hypothetical protein
MMRSTVSRSLPMRRARVLPILLLVFGCGNHLGPTNDLGGSWAATFSFPGSSLVLTLSQQGAGITGTGTYEMEAGGAGALQVVGTYHMPSVNLSLHYDYGGDHAYVGTVQDGGHIAGALDNFSLPLVRR